MSGRAGPRPAASVPFGVAGSRVQVEVDGRSLSLSNLDKVLYPDERFTKAGVLEHYRRVAPVLLPHLAGRPCTRKRWADGVAGPAFFEKNAPRGTPDWVRTVELDSPGSTRGSEVVRYVVVEDLATLLWGANLAALELHVPQWRVTGDGAPRPPDRMVVDLDPGPPADVATCARVALVVREVLEAHGMTVVPCTSGSKGMQLYVPVRARSVDRVRAVAAALAQLVGAQLPELMAPVMARRERPGRVYLDHGQNHPGKTTITPYSLRGREPLRVATPLRWDEVAAARTAADLAFGPEQVADRLDRHGDLAAPLLDRSLAHALPDLD